VEVYPRSPPSAAFPFPSDSVFTGSLPEEDWAKHARRRGIAFARLRFATHLAPGEEAAYGGAVGLPGLGIADLGGEEVDEPPAGPFTSLADDGGEVENLGADDDPDAGIRGGRPLSRQRWAISM
jgi:hypothetical protein